MNRAFVVLTLISSAVSTLPIAQQRNASLTEQKMCAEQAKKVFEEEKEAESESVNHSILYVSHYDSRDNICYVMTHVEWYQSNESVGERYTLTDAFEKHKFASYFGGNNNHQPRQPYCDVFVPGHPIKCSSLSEFLNLVDKNFNISF